MAQATLTARVDEKGKNQLRCLLFQRRFKHLNCHQSFCEMQFYVKTESHLKSLKVRIHSSPSLIWSM